MKIPVEFNALGELPEGWSWQPLQSLTANPKQDVVDGPFGSNLKASEYVSAGVPIARLQNIDRNTFVTKNIRFLTPAKAAELARHEFKPDNILITKLGDPLGKACIVPASIGRGVIVADLVRVRPDEKLVDHKYLTYAINSPTLVKQFELHTKGTTRPRVNLSVLRQLPIPLAPRKIQTDIVAEIEKQFSRLDEAVANLQRVKANLKRYKASVLKDAVKGRLVPTEAELARREGRSFENGEQLLQRILETRCGLWKGKRNYREPVAPQTTDLPEKPVGWVWASPEQLSAGEPYSLAIGPFGSSLKVSDYKTEGVPLVFVRNIRAVSFGGSDTVFVTPEKAEELKAHLVEAGDILVTKMGAPPGDVCLYPTNKPPAVITADCIKLRLMRAQLCVSFFGYAIESKLMQSQILGITKGVAQLKVSLGNFCSIAFPLPPVAEQYRIVAEVDRRLSLVRSVEAEVDANLKRAQALRQAVLQKKFQSNSRAGE